MEKENPVIKNYILSSERRIIKNDSPSESKFNTTIIENSQYHEPSKQNMVCFFLFL